MPRQTVYHHLNDKTHCLKPYRESSPSTQQTQIKTTVTSHKLSRGSMFGSIMGGRFSSPSVTPLMTLGNRKNRFDPPRRMPAGGVLTATQCVWLLAGWKQDGRSTSVCVLYSLRKLKSTSEMYHCEILSCIFCFILLQNLRFLVEICWIKDKQSSVLFYKTWI